LADFSFDVFEIGAFFECLLFFIDFKVSAIDGGDKRFPQLFVMFFVEGEGNVCVLDR
jgi:hypothetical protein